MTGQLQLALDLDDLADAERAAIDADFVERVKQPAEARRAKPCICTRSLVMIDELAAERRCALCGREPRR